MIIVWIFVVAFLISMAVVFTNVFAAIIGIILLVAPFVYSEANRTKTPQGRKSLREQHKREKEIEREYGIIDWEDR